MSLFRKAKLQYGGGPCELANTEPSTYRQLLQYYYHIKNSKPQSSIRDITLLINQELEQIWHSVSPRLLQIKMKSIEKNLHDLLTKVKDINRRHKKAAVKQKLDLILDKLFDISACLCTLNVLPCNDRRTKCDLEGCQEEHIFCACNPSCKVPLEERAYLKDQRLKKGPKGLYQMASVDRIAIKRFKRFSQTLIHSV